MAVIERVDEGVFGEKDAAVDLLASTDRRRVIDNGSEKRAVRTRRSPIAKLLSREPEREKR